jgi:hypothetical protein
MSDVKLGFFLSEAEAWDKYLVCAYTEIEAENDEETAEALVDVAAQIADKMLAARRARFAVAEIACETGDECGKPVLRDDGTDTGVKCSLVGPHNVCF